MKSIVALPMFLAACVNLPHVAPKLRTTQSDLTSTVVRLSITCTEQSPFSLAEDIEWIKPRGGMGVIVSERDVLTALHVVSCPTLPSIKAYLPNGHWQMMVVTREDSKNDLARLEIASADRFHLNVAPPVIGLPNLGIDVCTPLGSCGSILHATTNTVDVSLVSHPGDSGSPVYDTTGALIGLVSKGNGTVTVLSRLNKSWLSGT